MVALHLVIEDVKPSGFKLENCHFRELFGLPSCEHTFTA